MPDQKIKKTGTILMHNGKIHVEGFEVDGASCREAIAHSLDWAIGEMQRELTATIVGADAPTKTSLGLPKGVCQALGMTCEFCYQAEELKANG